MASTTINLLDYVKSKSQVDVDALDEQVSKDLGPFVDCTSNQIDAYFELLNPHNAALLKKSAALSSEICSQFPSVTMEELALEIAMLNLALNVVPYIKGDIHVMANPLYSYSAEKIVDNGQRLYHLCHYLDPNFNTSRLIIKVPSTWEGLQACHKLKITGVKTLATTLFTMEQAILAGEAGCISISPFVYELKVHFDETYHDTDPIFGLCVQAQRYYEKHQISTRVKACCVKSAHEVLDLAGVAAMTIPGDMLRELRGAEGLVNELEARSLFNHNSITDAQLELQTYINDEQKYRSDFARSAGGRGQMKTTQTIEIFCDYQKKAEAMMKEAGITHTERTPAAPGAPLSARVGEYANSSSTLSY